MYPSSSSPTVVRNDFRSKFRRALQFISILRVEPYMFLMMFQMSLKGTPGSQLLQDKICRSWYNTTADFCYNLPKMKISHGDPNDLQSKILADTAEFSMYHTMITTIPALVWSLFIGSWLDKYVKGRKLMMLISAGTGIIDTAIMAYLAIDFNASVYYNLISYLPSALAGGHLASHIAMWSYITITTPPKLRSLRFLIMELCMFLASPIGSALGGKLLNTKSIFNHEKLNYSLCFLIALAVEIVAFFWIYFAVSEEHAEKQQTLIEMKEKAKNPDFKTRSDKKKDEDTQDSGKRNNRHPLKMLLDLDNIKDMYRCVVKPRPNKIRTQIWMLLGCNVTMALIHRGPGQINFQFVQKIYEWGSEWYSYMNSVNMVVHTIATLTIVPFLIKIIKVHDIPLAIIGYCTNFFTMVIKGTVLTELGYYISVPIGSIGGISSIGTKTHFSKIVEMDELGKVFSFMSALDTIVPLVSSAAFTYIWKYTIRSYPGAIYQIVAAGTLIPISMLMWIDLYTERPKEIDNRRGRGGNNNQNNDQNKQKMNYQINNTRL